MAGMSRYRDTRPDLAELASRLQQLTPEEALERRSDREVTRAERRAHGLATHAEDRSDPARAPRTA